MKMNIITLDGKAAGDITLPKEVFGAEVRSDLIHRVVTWQLAGKRGGNADVKNRGEVRMTGAKMYKQKGMGKARHGNKSVNQFRGGGCAFGPTPRDFGFNLPKRVKAMAIASALSSKVADKTLVVLDEAKTKTHKTKDLISKLQKLELNNALFLLDSVDDNFERASRNIPHIRVLPTQGVNVYDIIKAEKLVVTKDAVPMLTALLEQRSNRKPVAVKEAK